MGGLYATCQFFNAANMEIIWETCKVLFCFLKDRTERAVFAVGIENCSFTHSPGSPKYFKKASC